MPRAFVQDGGNGSAPRPCRLPLLPGSDLYPRHSPIAESSTSHATSFPCVHRPARDTPLSCTRLILLMLFDTIEDMEQKQKAGQHTMTGRHYKVVSEWLERLGLIAVASPVVQKIVRGT